MKSPNLRYTEIEKNEYSHIKGHETVFNKIIEENFPNLKKEMAINVQEAYRTPNKWDQKTLLSHTNQNTKCTKQRKNIKNCK